ncbi:unnamed protein product [Hermetia illucens]|uniref:Protein kinase domain-containing protein n=1 Tax=Hermetia illucens TaxID=343691 RepID=A0A7R8UWA8_HERIL|nr:lymphokine-activated killer T-cell-originated protein kinase [Hermetia illucens]CAD7087083.1 unnamed protein product [Hermetia illucens]
METPRRVLRNRNLDNVASQFTPVKIPATPLLKQLGYGTGVNVYQLDRSPRNGKMMSPWALKRVSKKITQNNGEIYETRIKEEAEVLRNLVHPNIVGFRGVIKSADGKENLAIEYCNVSLYDMIEEKTEADDWTPFPASKIRKMCLDISKALDYLHNEAKILHGDIKSPNVLVKDDFEICKLCDFGVSLPLNKDGELDLMKNPKAKFVGTDLWAAPEALEDNIITDKCDIFSFGLVIYEMIALIPPHTWALNVGNKENDEDETIMEASFEPIIGTRPPLPESFELSDEYCPVVEIFYICTNELAEDRPTAKTLLKALNG